MHTHRGQVMSCVRPPRSSTIWPRFSNPELLGAVRVLSLLRAPSVTKIRTERRGVPSTQVCTRHRYRPRSPVPERTLLARSSRVSTSPGARDRSSANSAPVARASSPDPRRTSAYIFEYRASALS